MIRVFGDRIPSRNVGGVAMSVACMNHVLESWNEVEAKWDGRLIRRQEGELLITQRVLRAYRRSIGRTERLHSLIQSALTKDAAVEEGAVDAALFVETGRRPNWRELYVKLGGDAEKAVAKTPEKESEPHVRVFLRGAPKPKGRRIT
jgi:hypothetical protein